MIYTKKGDKGFTSDFNGNKIQKNSSIINIIGEIDELIAYLALSEVCLGNDILSEIIKDLYKISAYLSGHIESLDEKYLKERVLKIESTIDRCFYGKEIKNFVQPASNKKSAYLNLSRAICRRVERELISYLNYMNLNRNEDILIYMNRLSDFLFALFIFYEPNDLKLMKEKSPD